MAFFQDQCHFLRTQWACNHELLDGLNLPVSDRNCIFFSFPSLTYTFPDHSEEKEPDKPRPPSDRKINLVSKSSSSAFVKRTHTCSGNFMDASHTHIHTYTAASNSTGVSQDHSCGHSIYDIIVLCVALPVGLFFIHHTALLLKRCHNLFFSRRRQAIVDQEIEMQEVSRAEEGKVEVEDQAEQGVLSPTSDQENIRRAENLAASYQESIGAPSFRTSTIPRGSDSRNPESPTDAKHSMIVGPPFRGTVKRPKWLQTKQACEGPHAQPSPLRSPIDRQAALEDSYFRLTGEEWDAGSPFFSPPPAQVPEGSGRTSLVFCRKMITGQRIFEPGRRMSEPIVRWTQVGVGLKIPDGCEWL